MKTAAHQYEDKLLELAYGELPAHEASAVESHVRTCARCTEALSEIQSVRNAMGQLPMVPVPDTGLESLFAYADQAARRHAAGPAPGASWWRKLMAPVAALGALSLIGVFYVKANDEKLVPSRAEVAVNAQQGLKVDNLKANEPATPAAVAAAPVVAADLEAEAPVGQMNSVWTKEEAAQAMKQQAAGKLEEKKRDEYAAKTAVKAPSPAKKMAAPAKPSPSLGDQIAQAAELSKNKERRKTAEDDSSFGADYGKADKAGYKGEPAKDMKAEKPADRAQGEVALGLSSGNPGGANSRAMPQTEQAKPSAPPPPQMANAAEPPSRTAGGSGSSMGVGLGRSNDQQRQVVGQTQGNERVLREQNDAPASAPSAAATPNQMKSDLDARLRASEDARRSGNTQTEIDISMTVLRDSHATSAQRLRALTNVCNGLTQLELYEQANEYCTLLVREFPSSREAQAWQQSQSRIQRPAAKRSSKSKVDFDEEKAAPAPAEKEAPSQAAPAYSR